nr:MAG TPA: hypothetical protein [Caudoviricetes sp.]
MISLHPAPSATEEPGLPPDLYASLAGCRLTIAFFMAKCK